MLLLLTEMTQPATKLFMVNALFNLVERLFREESAIKSQGNCDHPLHSQEHQTAGGESLAQQGVELLNRHIQGF